MLSFADLCSVTSGGDFIATDPMLLQRFVLIEVFPAPARPRADIGGRTKTEALEGAVRGIRPRRITNPISIRPAALAVDSCCRRGTRGAQPGGRGLCRDLIGAGT